MPILPFYPVSFAYYQYVGLFAVAGAVKLVPPVIKELTNKFPSLPSWMWPIVGLWELSIVGLYSAGYHAASAHMSFMILGGAVYSQIFLKKDGKSMVEELSPLVLITPLLSFVSTLKLCEINNVDLWPSVVSTLGGIFIGVIVSK